MLSPSTSNVVLSLPNLKQLEAGDFNLDELVKRLTEVLTDDSQRNEILQLTGDIAVLVIECLDNVISSNTFKAVPDIQTRSKVFSTISRLSRSCQYLPRSYWINQDTITLTNEPYTSGTCAEVYLGTHNGESVAVKVLRTSNQESTAKLKKRFCREAIVWKHVSCPYILKFNGAFYHNDVPAIVTPWMALGNIAEYLKKHPDANRLRLFVGVIKGVRYLHSCNIAHGDIKGPNILISDSTPPRAVIADLGFIRVTTFSVKLSSEERGTTSFMAPELLHSARFGLEKGVPSKEADIYALGMTVYQVLTGQWPFYPKREAEVMHAVISGERPLKPENAEEIGMTEAVWDLLGECWREDRTKRPVISEVLGRFCEITGERKTADSAIELRLDTSGKGSSVNSDNSSPTTPSSLRGSDTDRRSLSTTTTVLSTPFDYLDSEEISEAREKNPTKDDTTTNKNQSATQTNFRIKENLVVKKPDIGKTSAVDILKSPVEIPGRYEARTGSKRRYVWHLFKQLIVRSQTCDSAKSYD